MYGTDCVIKAMEKLDRNAYTRHAVRAQDASRSCMAFCAQVIDIDTPAVDMPADTRALNGSRGILRRPSSKRTIASSQPSINHACKAHQANGNRLVWVEAAVLKVTHGFIGMATRAPARSLLNAPWQCSLWSEKCKRCAAANVQRLRGTRKRILGHGREIVATIAMVKPSLRPDTGLRKLTSPA